MLGGKSQRSQSPTKPKKILTELHGKQKKGSIINLCIRRKYACQDFINYQDGKNPLKKQQI